MGAGSGVILNFLRVYIVIGFIIAILLNVFIIRMLVKAIVLLEKNQSLLEVITHQPVKTNHDRPVIVNTPEEGK